MSYQAIYSLVTRFSLRWSQITPRALRAKSSKGINFLSVAIILLACSAQDAKAQKILTIGSLNTAEQFIDAFEGFKSRMVELGYKEGHNVRYAHHNSNGNPVVGRWRAKNLGDKKWNIIIPPPTPGRVVAAKATAGTRIPVVFLSAG